MMNPSLVNGALMWVGGALVAIAHANVITQPWAQIIGELGAGLVLLARRRMGDVPLSELPKEIQDSVRPPTSKAP